MEKFRHKRSKITARPDRSSRQIFFTPESPIPRGNMQVGQKNHLHLTSDSSSCSSSVAGEYSTSLQFGWKSLKQTSGTPIKTFLVPEMSTVTESKRRTLGVVARLMGLDRLPLQQPAYGKDSFNNNYHRPCIKKDLKTETFDDHLSSRRSSKEQQEFKDVFEVSEISKVEKNKCSSQGNMDSEFTDPEMQQKFMDAKCLSTDRNSQNLKEFLDDSNKDLLKYFEHPDSLFTKHLNDLQAAPLNSHQYEKVELCWKSERGTSHSNYRKSYKGLGGGSLGHCSRRNNSRPDVHSSSKSSKFHLEQKDERAACMTRIVVLKPNLGKVYIPTKNFSSPCSPNAFQSDCGKHTDFPNIQNKENKLKGRKRIPEVLLSRKNSSESRKIAREITRQMKNNVTSSSMIFSSSRFKGYVGDENSCNFTGKESTDESEITAPTSRNSDLDYHHRSASFHSTESPVTREAKKRLSMRWKMTQKSHERQVISGGSTLADMLSVPDNETKPTQFNAIVGSDNYCNKISSNHEPEGWPEPLGLSSRDDWKDGCIKNFPRLKSVPASTVSGSPRTSLRHEALSSDRFLTSKVRFKQERNKAIKGLEKGEGTNRKKSKSGNWKSRSACYMDIYSGNDEYSPKIDNNQNKVNSDFEGNSLSEQVLMVCETFAGNRKDKSLVPEEAVDVGHDIGSIESRSADVVSEPSSCLFAIGETSVAKQPSLVQQEISVRSSDESLGSSQPPVPGLESSSTCEDAVDQPSPVSVLKPYFTDDVSSSSECFESLCADLHGLRMQLNLLKLECEVYAEGSMLISSDEDGGELPQGNSDQGDRMRKTQDIWEPSYIDDVLIYSGFIGAHPDTFLALWYTPEHPVSPLLFDEMEKKYYDQTSCSKSERRLLFDRINSGLVEIHRQFTDTHPWVNSLTMELGSKLSKIGVQDALSLLLASQENNVGELLAGETQWLDLKEEIDVIGREVERMLIEELVAGLAS